jgi:hypothetical protein
MDIITLREHLKNRQASLEQDLEAFDTQDSMDWYHITGQVNTVKYILGLINE